MLDVQDLCFRYPDGREALQGVTFQMARGEKVALVGPNGAGKSTLILHLNGVLQARSGRVKLDGEPRQTVGLVFQDPDDQLFCPTVREDVAFGPRCQKLPRDEVDRRVTQSLQSVGMLDYIDRSSPHLSHGEKKRIALATVLAMRPQLLALDEPTAGLDPRARRELINLLQTLDLAMLVSTHDLRMVSELFPRSILLEKGCIIADRATPALLGDDALLEKHGLVPLCACYQGVR